MTSYFAIFMTLSFVAPLGSEQTQPAEYEVKAAFIFNFARYIQWPKEADAHKPFVLAVLGKDPFGAALDDVVRGQKVQGRSLVIKRLTQIDGLTDCDILFISASESGRLRQILNALHQAPVLTIGDMDRFAEHGGMINLTSEENHIRFEMNVQAIERAGLKAGSQLLRLARIVTEARSDGQ